MPGDAEYEDMIGQFGSHNVERAIVIADIDRTSTSCGFSVPFMDFREERNQLDEHWGKKTEPEVDEYWKKKNATSIDGLPALDT